VAKWWHCIVNGRQYGPVGEDVFRSWIAARRVGPDDYVWTDGMQQWQPAGQVPGLFFTPPPEPGQPLAPPLPVGVAGPVKPHRGGAVLALGIIGLVLFCCCFIPGVIAWVMGSHDLAEMAAGRMDRSGQAATRAGKILGIVGVVLFCVVVLLALLGGHHSILRQVIRELR
jgi:hypothetical protein